MGEIQKSTGTSLQTYSAKLQEITKFKASSLPELFDNLEKSHSLGLIKKENGEKMALAVIVGGIADMIDGLPHDISEKAILRLAKFILKQHYNLRPAEFQLVGDRLLRKDLFGKITINTIANELDKYWHERLCFAEEQAIMRASQYKGTQMHGDIEKAYEALKNEPVKKETLGSKLRKSMGNNYCTVMLDEPVEVEERDLYEFAMKIYKKGLKTDPDVKTYRGIEKLSALVPKPKKP